MQFWLGPAIAVAGAAAGCAEEGFAAISGAAPLRQCPIGRRLHAEEQAVDIGVGHRWLLEAGAAVGETASVAGAAVVEETSAAGAAAVTTAAAVAREASTIGAAVVGAIPLVPPMSSWLPRLSGGLGGTRELNTAYSSVTVVEIAACEDAMGDGSIAAASGTRTSP